MKLKFKIIMSLFIVLILGLSVLSSCGNSQTAKLVNEQHFSLDGIETVTISFDDETVSFYESDDENLTIKEYMSNDKKDYYAKVNQNGDGIQIREGEKPLSKKSFVRYVEVYMPVSYARHLEVTTTDGDIDMSGLELHLASLRIDCTSGTLRLNKAAAENLYLTSTSGNLELGEISGDEIKIETTQGNVSCGKMNGNVTYHTTSGNAEFLAVKGAGTYRAENSGRLSVSYDDVTGDLYLYNKNDDIELRVPSTLSFELEAVTKNGKINTDFQDDISADGSTVSTSVGSDPNAVIKLESKNGNIELRK